MGGTRERDGRGRGWGGRGGDEIRARCGRKHVGEGMTWHRISGQERSRSTDAQYRAGSDEEAFVRRRYNLKCSRRKEVG